MISRSVHSLVEVCACSAEFHLAGSGTNVGGTRLLPTSESAGDRWMFGGCPVAAGRYQGAAQDVCGVASSRRGIPAYRSSQRDICTVGSPRGSHRFPKNVGGSASAAAVAVGRLRGSQEWPAYADLAGQETITQRSLHGCCGARARSAHLTGTRAPCAPRFLLQSLLDMKSRMTKHSRNRLLKGTVAEPVLISTRGLRRIHKVQEGKEEEVDRTRTCNAVGGDETRTPPVSVKAVGGEETRRERESDYKAVQRESEGEGERVEFRLFNTMTKQKDVFVPKVEGKVGMYVCGVTAYDYSHIGHARVYVAFDVLYRYLMALGYKVTYVRNFTDVDDKIIARAAAIGEDPLNLSTRFCEEFQMDMAALRCLPPSIEPKVSTHIKQIIDMIQSILDNGHGYVVEGGDVFFSVDSIEGYGALSGRKQEQNRAGERVTLDQRKKNPADFALWKSAKPREPAWASPWGHGRPGWHIECSAMSAEHLGHEFDIHGGGRDLIFPHHENELAQSRAACKGSHISYWVHNGFVTVDAEKMSKSLGNFFTIREVLDVYHPLALRWFLLGTHYRSPINYAKRQLEEASDRVFYLFQFQNSNLDVKAEIDMQEVDPEPDRVLEELRQKALQRAGLTGEELAARMRERADARLHKDWRRADEIRDELAAVGIMLMDGGDGTLWRPAPVIDEIPKPVASSA
ncbi:hypothetical protein CBR_g49346 [Chara braunii]|uniref:cysteine--tRNA ligase n=1 Tax=Chara braunii TaxID=69332 RepID=A0A388M4Q0_CHABU|nr:hypothetical protein CBR_g49346 [Chara braunii]|eukprot:GBG89557.1 hypothetical protein CBR_g49346 [Chara braunii]